MKPNERQKKLLDDLGTGKITKKDFDQEIAYWVITEGFEELVPRPLPSMPILLREYHALPKEKKFKTDESFWRKPEVINYMEQSREIEAENRANVVWLMDVHDWIPEGDELNRGKVKERLEEFSIKGYS